MAAVVAHPSASSPESGGAERSPRLSARGLTKRFDDVVAADSLDLDFFPGEIHAVLGENGAGKSTLVKMLYGYYRPDAGELHFQGQATTFHSPAAARQHGIGMVFQNFTLIPALTVLENVALTETRRHPLIDRRGLRRKLLQMAERYGLDVRPDAYVRDLAVGERQRVEILKLLASDATTLILDEPTSVLAPHEVDALLDTMRALRDDGYAVILITHKMREVLATADRVTVLRRGKVVSSGGIGDFDERSLVQMMVGADADMSEDFSFTASAPAGEGMAMRGVCLRKTSGHTLRDVDLHVARGEILGIAAVSGNGQAELGEALLGTVSLDHGSIHLGGRDMTHASTAQRLAAGLAVIPEDPLVFGAVPTMTVRENLMLTAARFEGRGRLLLRPALLARTARAIAELSPFALPEQHRAVETLSGGNVQRVVVTREMGEHARYLVAYHPTRGLDIGSTRAVQSLLLDARSRGCAVLLITEDLDELLALSDRVAVMHGGRIVGEFGRAETDRFLIGKLMTGAATS